MLSIVKQTCERSINKYLTIETVVFPLQMDASISHCLTNAFRVISNHNPERDPLHLTPWQEAPKDVRHTHERPFARGAI